MRHTSKKFDGGHNVPPASSFVLRVICLALPLFTVILLYAPPAGDLYTSTETPYTSYGIIANATPEIQDMPYTPYTPDVSQEVQTPHTGAAVPTPDVSDGGSAGRTGTPAPEVTPGSPYTATPHPPLEDGFFDKAVFIGDSVTLKLQYYIAKQRRNGSSVLGDAQFLSAGGMGSGNALNPLGPDSIHPTYQGEKMLLQDAIAKIKADKLYIMLGMNDLNVYGLDGSLKNMDTLIKKIREKSPAISVYIESVTPILKGKERKLLKNENIEKYDAMLQELCKQMGYTFIDVASVLRDSEGYLTREYCSDPDGMGMHLTDSGCVAWIDVLYRYS